MAVINLATIFNKKVILLISCILLAISLLNFALFIENTDLHLGWFGLISTLSISYFASVMLLIISFLLNIKFLLNRKLFLAQIIALIVFLFLTPALFEGTIRFRSAYKVLGFSEYILRNGFINTNDIIYHNWPGAIILISSIQYLTTSDFCIYIVKYYPSLIELLYLLPLFIFYNKLTTNTRIVWISIFIFYLLNFLNQDYLSPQSISYFLYLLMLIILIGTMVKSDLYVKWTLDDPRTRFLAFTIFVGIAVSHILTSVFLLSILIGINCYLYLYNKYSKDVYRFSSESINIIRIFSFFCIIFFLIWTFYGAMSFLEQHLVPSLIELFNLDLVLHHNLNERVAGSFSHVVISQLAILSVIMSMALMLLGFLNNRKSINNTSLLAILISIVAILPIYPYGGEMLMRIFLFAIPIISFMMAQVILSKRLWILIILFLAMMPLSHILIHYGNERFDYVSPAEISFFDFYFQKCSDLKIIGGFPVYAYKFQEKLLGIDLDQALDKNKRNFNKQNLNNDNYLIAIGLSEKIQYEQFYNDTIIIPCIESYLNNYTNCKKIYDNNDVGLFYCSRLNNSGTFNCVA